jgi:monoamine oxidase
VHGSAPEILEVVKAAQLVVCDIHGNRWRSDRGKLLPMDDDEFWSELHRVMRRLDPKRTPDRSFQEFLDTKPGGASLARERALAREFVESFHAADLSRVGERALADGGMPDDDTERRQGRILDGYDRVPQTLMTGLSNVRLAHTVKEISWEPGAVEVRCDRPDGGSATVSARAAIITVPLGVLQSEDGACAIRFTPNIEDTRRAASQLAMGAVARMTLLFREPFWESDAMKRRTGGRSLAGMTFLQTSDEDVPVWWTSGPVRAATLVGWAGGSKAERLVASGPQEVELRAIAALARLFGMQRRRIASLVEQCWYHDWTHDPYTLGAYSYTLVGGQTAAKRLARPVADTLFFAGEAADSEGRTGTVHGAMGTGYRAATAVLRLTRNWGQSRISSFERARARS